MIQTKFINIDVCIQFHLVVFASLLLVTPAALIPSSCDSSQHSLEECSYIAGFWANPEAKINTGGRK